MHFAFASDGLIAPSHRLGTRLYHFVDCLPLLGAVVRGRDPSDLSLEKGACIPDVSCMESRIVYCVTFVFRISESGDEQSVGSLAATVQKVICQGFLVKVEGRRGRTKRNGGATVAKRRFRCHRHSASSHTTTQHTVRQISPFLLHDLLSSQDAPLSAGMSLARQGRSPTGSSLPLLSMHLSSWNYNTPQVTESSRSAAICPALPL